MVLYNYRSDFDWTISTSDDDYFFGTAKIYAFGSVKLSTFNF